RLVSDWSSDVCSSDLRGLSTSGTRTKGGGHATSRRCRRGGGRNGGGFCPIGPAPRCGTGTAVGERPRCRSPAISPADAAQGCGRSEERRVREEVGVWG